MGDVLVRYKVKAGRGDENQELVEAVFAELAAQDAGGVRYATMRLADGVSFVHVARIEGDDNPLADLASFAAFQSGLMERCEARPVASAVTLVGDHQLFT